MNKTKVKKILLTVLPLAAVGVGITPGSVKVSAGETMQNLTFLDPVEGPIQGLAAPTAAILSYVLFALVVIWLFRKKKGLLGAIAVVALASSCFAVAPLLFRSPEMLILPSVLHPVLMLAEALLAYSMVLKPDVEAPADTGRRLKSH